MQRYHVAWRYTARAAPPRRRDSVTGASRPGSGLCPLSTGRRDTPSPNPWVRDAPQCGGEKTHRPCVLSGVPAVPTRRARNVAMPWPPSSAQVQGPQRHGETRYTVYISFHCLVFGEFIGQVKLVIKKVPGRGPGQARSRSGAQQGAEGAQRAWLAPRAKAGATTFGGGAFISISSQVLTPLVNTPIGRQSGGGRDENLT